jgi:ABC-type microcin C transport system duplicated ATPase subunit YejF
LFRCAIGLLPTGLSRNTAQALEQPIGLVRHGLTAPGDMRIRAHDQQRLRKGEAGRGSVNVAPLGQLRQLRGNAISMIFQEPMTALNPLYTVGDQIGEVLRTHRGLSRSDARAKAIDLLKAVQVPAAEARANAYPHQLSGGMRNAS